MKALLRNVAAVVLLRPGAFLEPHPRVLRAYSVASIIVSVAACGMFSVEKLILFYVLGFLCMVNGPYPWGRRYGSTGPWRAMFALAWCAPLAASFSSMLDVLFVDFLLSGYLFLAVVLQTEAPETEDEWFEETSERERAELRAVRAAPAGVAMSSSGYVSLRELGPPLAQWQGFVLPDYVIDTDNRRWVFQDTTAPDPSALDDRQILLPPGAVYQLV